MLDIRACKKTRLIGGWKVDKRDVFETSGIRDNFGYVDSVVPLAVLDERKNKNFVYSNLVLKG